MKSKKIIASVLAMSVMSMSSMSFAAVTIRNSNITDLTIKKANTEVKLEGSTSIGNIFADDQNILDTLNLDKTALTNPAAVKEPEVKTPDAK